MEETEVPTEHLQEEMQHHATQGGTHGEASGWITWVALSSALLAALAALSAMLSGHHANEAMIEQLHASDHWSLYQAKSIKAAILSSKHGLLESQGQAASEKERDKLKEYEKEQAEISDEAKGEEASSRHHLNVHEIYARAVTFSQVAIAIGAISVLTRRRRFFFVSIGSGLIGVVFLIQGLLA